MPIDTEKWEEMMIETGKIQDKEGFYHYNPSAIEDPVGYVYRKQKQKMTLQVRNKLMKGANPHPAFTSSKKEAKLCVSWSKHSQKKKCFRNQ